MPWMYALEDENDNNSFISYKGDCGVMSQALVVTKDENGKERVLPEDVIENSEPIVGACMRVGSHYARSLSGQDYWTTTPIIEILSEKTTDNHLEVKFKTRSGSTYLWKSAI